MTAVPIHPDVSLRLLPLLCFTCGMPVNNRQHALDTCTDDDASPSERMTALGITRLCCRVVLQQSAVWGQLAPPAGGPENTFTHITHLPSVLEAFPAVLNTDGSTPS